MNINRASKIIEMDKKELRSMKNRESAVKSRQKKEELIEQLSEQVRMYTSEINHLRCLNKSLRSSIPGMSGEEEMNLNHASVQRILEPAVFCI